MKRVMMQAGCVAAFVLAFVAFGAGAAAANDSVDSLVAPDVAPVRTWRALHRQLEADGLTTRRIDEQRFEATVKLPGAGEVQFDIDWDEHSGGSRLAWHAANPDASRAAMAWMKQVAARAHSERQDNHLCRGEHPQSMPEPSMEGAASCNSGTGRFSSALFELEKCGDYESALTILAACVKEQHAGGMLRLAWFYENGLGLPQRPERMTEYLRQASESATPGYPETARVQYATALYFGVGTPPDRERALRMFRELAKAGNADAIHFLRHGYHTAWRRQDGSLYVDSNWHTVQNESARLMQDAGDASVHSEFRRPDEGFVGTKTREQVQRELQESLTDPVWQATKREFYAY